MFLVGVILTSVGQHRQRSLLKKKKQIKIKLYCKSKLTPLAFMFY